MEANFFTRHPQIKDVLNFFMFVVIVFIGTVLINAFVFRSFSVSGHSMDYTLKDGERLIVNRIPLTAAQLSNTAYVPHRGEIIVFKNPRFIPGSADEYIVKRTIAFPGERVTVNNGVLLVYNESFPEGFNPDTKYQVGGKGPQQPTSGDGVNIIVPDGTIFVAGDNRIGDNSYDSRTGLGMIPVYDIIGPVALRIWPLPELTIF